MIDNAICPINDDDNDEDDDDEYLIHTLALLYSPLI